MKLQAVRVGRGLSAGERPTESLSVVRGPAVGRWNGWRWGGLLFAVIAGPGGWACGARDAGTPPFELGQLEATPVARWPDGSVRCASKADCPVEDICQPMRCEVERCVKQALLSCNDGDPCTLDRCDPNTGTCAFQPLALDEDGDGYLARIPGVSGDVPLACGTDCDDTTALAYPGGAEVCDGVDNDCNGIVDDGFGLSSAGSAPVLISPEGEQAGLGGIVFNGEFFAISYSSTGDNHQTRLVGVDGSGGERLEDTDVARVNSDTFSGPVVWTGRAFGLAWEDRRDDDFEIYFNRMDAEGNKLGPDVRITDAPDFSINPSLRYTGSEFLLFWQDRRLPVFGYGIWGQRLSRNGELVGENVHLTSDVAEAEGPATALGEQNLGLAFNAMVGNDRQVLFRTVSLDMQSLGEAVLLSEPGAAGASVNYNAGNYIVAWEEYKELPGDSIWGAVVSADSEVLIQPTRLTGPGTFTRSHRLLPMGDRLILLWAEYDGDRYEIFQRMLSAELEPLTEPVQLTSSVGESLWPAAALGSQGELGVAYTLKTDGLPQIYFTTLSCQ